MRTQSQHRNIATPRHLISSSPPLPASAPGWATNNDTSATSCSACEASRYSTEGNNAGADACEPCPAGQFQIASGQTGCNDCPLNQFQAEPGQYLCQVSDFLRAPATHSNRTARTSTRTPPLAQDCEATEGAGFGAVEGSSSCDICQATYFLRAETELCELCEGDYSRSVMTTTPKLMPTITMIAKSECTTKEITFT